MVCGVLTALWSQGWGRKETAVAISCLCVLPACAVGMDWLAGSWPEGAVSASVIQSLTVLCWVLALCNQGALLL
jgi:hypothetical protein